MANFALNRFKRGNDTACGALRRRSSRLQRVLAESHHQPTPQPSVKYEQLQHHLFCIQANDVARKNDKVELLRLRHHPLDKLRAGSGTCALGREESEREQGIRG